MTGEHIWPVWMHSLLPKLDNPNAVQEHMINNLDKSIKKHSTKTRQGHTYTKKIRNVCKNCNETWMSDIEQSVISIISPLVQGIPCVVDHEAQNKIATWLALKMMILDHEEAKDAVISLEAREKFKEMNIIPESISIWIGNHNEPSWYTTCWRRTMLATIGSQSPPLRLDIKNVQTTTIGIGRFIAYSFITTLSDLKFTPTDFENSGALKRIWPTNSQVIDWPTATLSETEINDLRDTIIQLINAPFSRSFP